MNKKNSFIFYAIYYKNEKNGQHKPSGRFDVFMKLLNQSGK